MVVWGTDGKLTSNCGCCRTAFHAVPKSRLTLVGSAGTILHLRPVSSTGLGLDTGGPKVSWELFLIIASKSLFDLGHSFALCGDGWPLLLPLVLASLLFRVKVELDPGRVLVSGRVGGVTCCERGDIKLFPVVSGKNVLNVRRSSIEVSPWLGATGPPPPKSSSYEFILTSAGPAPKDAQAFGVGSRKEVNMGFEAMVWYGIPLPLNSAEFGDDPLVTPGPRKVLNMLSQDMSLPFVVPFAIALAVGGGEMPKPPRESVVLNASNKCISGVGLLVGGVGFCVKTGSVGDWDG